MKTREEDQNFLEQRKRRLLNAKMTDALTSPLTHRPMLRRKDEEPFLFTAPEFFPTSPVFTEHLWLAAVVSTGWSVCLNPDPRAFSTPDHRRL